jgi:hypothetical protein
MKIAIQIDGEEVALAKLGESISPAEILGKAAALGAEDAGPAQASAFVGLPVSMPALGEMEEVAFSREMAINCGEAPKEFQSYATPEMQVLEYSIEPNEAKDAGKAAQL